MPVSAAQFEHWLLRGGQRTLLAEAKAYSGAAEVTRCFSNRAFISEPGDTPANTPYDDIVLSDTVRFAQRLSELLTGSTIPAWGDLQVTNENGDRDAWLGDSWDGRSLKLYLGDASWRKSDFRLILNGVTADIYSPQRGRLAFRMRDKTWMLNVPAQTALVGGTTANKDQVKPLGYGPHFNAEPVLDVAATHHYIVHGGAIDAVTAVRDNGAAVAYAADLAGGGFTLNAAPVGRITCDFRGAKPGGVYLVKCADIVKDLIVNHSQLTADDLDLANFTAFNATCPQSVHIYVRGRENLIDVIDELVTSVGGFWTFSRDGALQLGRIAAPAGAPVMTITADDIRPRQLSVLRRELPITVLRLGYKRNWTPQADGLAGSLTETERAAYAAEYLVSKAENAGLTTAWKLARRPDLVPTLLTDAAETDTETARRQALHDVVRTTYRAAAYMAPFKVNLGNEIRLQHPRFGFSAGQDAIVVGIEEEVLKGRATVDVWR